MPWLFFALSVIYLAFTIADAFGDVAIELGKQTEWHFWGAIQAGIFIAVLSYSIHGTNWITAALFISLVLLRFPVFNILHNLRKGQKWYYLSDHGIDGFVKKIIKWIFPVILFIFPSVVSAQHYAVLSPISDSVADYYIYPDSVVNHSPEIRISFPVGNQLKSTGTGNATVPEYYFIFNVSRPVRSNQLIDAYKVFAKDPEKTIVSHYCKGGTGQRYFSTERYKGGIRVKDYRTINKAAKTWTYNVFCYDRTGLYCVAYCNIVVK